MQETVVVKSKSTLTKELCCLTASFSAVTAAAASTNGRLPNTRRSAGASSSQSGQHLTCIECRVEIAVKLAIAAQLMSRLVADFCLTETTWNRKCWNHRRIGTLDINARTLCSQDSHRPNQPSLNAGLKSAKRSSTSRR